MGAPSTSQSKQIIDPEVIHDLLSKLVFKTPANLTGRAGEFQIQVFSHKKGCLLISKVPEYEQGATRHLVFHHDYKSVHVECYVTAEHSKKEEVTPMRIWMTDSPRTEDRQLTGSEEINVGSLIGLKEIGAIVQGKNKIIGDMVYAVENKLTKIFDAAKVFVYYGGDYNLRLKGFLSDYRPIYYSAHAESEEYDDNVFPLSTYYHEIRAKDPRSKGNEVCVPLVFGGTLPYGYVQVASNRMIDKTVINSVKSMAEKIENGVNRVLNIGLHSSGLKVNDISSGGIGIRVDDRRTVRHFDRNSSIHFCLSKPGSSSRAHFSAEVRNIAYSDGNYLIGAAFTNISSPAQKLLDEILSEIRTDE